MARTTRWLLPPSAGVSELPAGVPRPVAQILASRGIHSGEDLRRHLSLSHLPYDPALLPDMDVAVDRLREAVNRGERVGVFGDFDVDGITGTAILAEGLKSLGADPIPYLPLRSEEGHGLSRTAIDSLIASGATLIVTVDCGITDAEEVAYASQRGVEVVITDHHVPPGGLPDARACVNAKLPGSNYPFNELCGAGLALKVIHGLHNAWAVPYDPSLLELAALGSVADLVPLLDENRYFVSQGIERLKTTDRPGLRALYEVARINQEEIDSEKIAFQIAPRLNAAGRMGDAADSYRLLTTRSYEEGRALAERLEQLNQQRRQATEEAAALAFRQVESMPSLPGMIVVVEESIQQGVAGLVASRISERYRRPAAVLTVDGANAVASARSVPEYNLIEGIRSCADLLVRFGGHEQAAGFTIPVGDIPELTKRIVSHAEGQIDWSNVESVQEIDAVVSLRELDEDLYEWLKNLEPFGKGNRRPTFAVLNAVIKEARLVGHSQQHLKLRVEDEGHEMTALAFNQAEDWPGIAHSPGSQPLDLAFTLMLDTWQGQTSLALRVANMRIPER